MCNTEGVFQGYKGTLPGIYLSTTTSIEKILSRLGQPFDKIYRNGFPCPWEYVEDTTIQDTYNAHVLVVEKSNTIEQSY